MDDPVLVDVVRTGSATPTWARADDLLARCEGGGTAGAAVVERR